VIDAAAAEGVSLMAYHEHDARGNGTTITAPGTARRKSTAGPRIPSVLLRNGGTWRSTPASLPQILQNGAVAAPRAGADQRASRADYASRAVVLTAEGHTRRRVPTRRRRPHAG